MLNSIYRWLHENPVVLWLCVGGFVVVNVWFDYYNPGAALIDGVIVLIVLIAVVRSRFN